MKKKLLNLIICIIILQTGIFAQSINHKNEGIICGTSEQMKAYYKAHPESKSEIIEQEEFTKNYSAKDDTISYIIPVVFHVFGTNFNGSAVSTELIKNALQKTNEDFQGITSDWNQIISEFNDVKKPIKITFKLAKIDPDGNPTVGVTYHSVKSGFGNGYGYDSEIQKYAWDNYKYMNIYVQNDLYNTGVTNNSGVSWYPSTSMSNNNLARVVYNGAYIGSNTSENFRSVLTHEFGHFLNLIHPFEDGCPDAGSCITSGDKICDTPPEDDMFMEGDTNCLGNVTNWQNFMTYTSQYAMFTVDQVARMKAALEMPSRKPLWQESNLIATGIVSCSYCASKGADQQSDWITGVQIGDFSKTTAAESEGYGDYTNDTISLEKGGSISVTLTPNTDQNTEAFKVWINYNNDCDFDDEGEEVMSGSAQGSTTGTINVPLSASGTATMRISMRYNTAPESPCGDIDKGEVEDYTVRFVEPTTATSIYNPAKTKPTEVLIYPNPNNGAFKVSVTSNKTGLTVLKIINMNGQLLVEKKIIKSNKTENISLNTNLNPGVYNLQVITGNESLSKTFIVE